MELFSIARLKTTLAHGALPARETAAYLAAQAALLSIGYIPTPADQPTGWAFAAYPVLAVVGVYYCYRCNGGATGRRFAERYLAIGWVVGVKVAAVVLGAGLAGSIGLGLSGSNFEWLESPRVADGVDFVGLGLIALVYWRMGVHLADVHQRTVR